jgi:hypothetical protein
VSEVTDELANDHVVDLVAAQKKKRRAPKQDFQSESQELPAEENESRLCAEIQVK